VNRRSIDSSAEGRAVIAAMREALRERGDDYGTPIAKRRDALAAFAARASLPPEVNCTAETLGARSALRLAPVATATPMRHVLYLHGGAYVLGSADTHKALAARYVAAAPAIVHALDYRLAPEHPYPAALEDAVAAACALSENGGDCALLGDSAGGGLALATAIALRDEGALLPRQIVLVSPWVDLTLSGPSMDEKAEDDPMLSRRGLEQDAGRYRGRLPAEDWRVSPLFADLSGLPPVFLQVGDAEVLRDDTLRLAHALAAAQVEVTLEIWRDMTHAWTAFPAPEADAAVRSGATFLAV
jgi:epsilon-lactone hydrolase